jgi:hypothetical protein
MQRATVVTSLIAAAVFAVVGWFVGSQSGKVSFLSRPPSGDCRGKDCTVNILFDCTSNPCVPYADRDVILTTSNHKIEFQIDPTTNYDFDQSDGIKFTSGNANGYFPCQPQGKKKYKCDIASGTPPGLYKYWVHVQGLNVVDPWVVNN